MKIVHISKHIRHGALGIHLGGVSKFAMYLQLAMPEIEVAGWEDFPGWQEHDLAQEWEQAPLLNEWLLEQGLVDRETIAIVDGFWGLGLEGKVAKLISVCHGSFAGAMAEHMRNPWDNGFLLGQSVRHQEEFWRESGCEIVAVSPNAARELSLLANLDSTVICNGIDLETYGPRVPNLTGAKKGLILEVTGGHPAKGAHIVEALKKRGYNIEAHGVTDGNLEHEAERWAEAEIALFPSFYEGNSYALLEAMACNCKIVGYWTGFVPDLLWPHKVGEFIDDHHVVAFAHAIDMARICAYETRRFVPDFNAFAKEWRDYLCVS